jgi:hypothetical protein
VAVVAGLSEKQFSATLVWRGISSAYSVLLLFLLSGDGHFPDSSQEKRRPEGRPKSGSMQHSSLAHQG